MVVERLKELFQLTEIRGACLTRRYLVDNTERGSCQHWDVPTVIYEALFADKDCGWLLRSRRGCWKMVPCRGIGFRHGHRSNTIVLCIIAYHTFMSSRKLDERRGAADSQLLLSTRLFFIEKFKTILEFSSSYISITHLRILRQSFIIFQHSALIIVCVE